MGVFSYVPQQTLEIIIKLVYTVPYIYNTGNN